MTNPEYRPTEFAYPSQETDDRTDLLYAASFPNGEPGWGHIITTHEKLEPGHVDVITWRNKGGMVCAFIVRYHLTRPPNPSDGTLYLWVHPAFRHVGIGMQLLEQAYSTWEIRLEGQLYTANGAGLTNTFVERKKAELDALDRPKD